MDGAHCCFCGAGAEPAAPARTDRLAGPAASFVFKAEGLSDTFLPGAKLFADREYVVAECPVWLKGKTFLKNSIDRAENWRIVESGILTVLTPEPHPKATTQIDALEASGFDWIDSEETFQLFGKSEWNRVRVYQK